MKIDALRTFDCPCYDRKSFYGKAKIHETENGYFLQSYNTIICYIDKPNGNAHFLKFWDSYSVTTMRHINSFLRFNGLSLGGKNWWTKLEKNRNYTISELLNI